MSKLGFFLFRFFLFVFVFHRVSVSTNHFLHFKIRISLSVEERLAKCGGERDGGSGDTPKISRGLEVERKRKKEKKNDDLQSHFSTLLLRAGLPASLCISFPCPETGSVTSLIRSPRWVPSLERGRVVVARREATRDAGSLVDGRRSDDNDDDDRNCRGLRERAAASKPAAEFAAAAERQGR